LTEPIDHAWNLLQKGFWQGVKDFGSILANPAQNGKIVQQKRVDRQQAEADAQALAAQQQQAEAARQQQVDAFEQWKKQPEQDDKWAAYQASLQPQTTTPQTTTPQTTTQPTTPQTTTQPTTTQTTLTKPDLFGGM
jgi:hypothetical protein